MSLIKLASERSPNGQSHHERMAVQGHQVEIGTRHQPIYAAEQIGSDLSIDFLTPPSVEGMYQSLLTKTRIVCDRSRIQFSLLSTIQRKFVTHYRCTQCGLQPLYNLDLTHIKRVRCRKCGQTVPLKNGGKYGRLRKAIAIELWHAGKEWREVYNCN